MAYAGLRVVNKGVDYSKWDNLELSDEEDERPKGQPRVTRLEPGTRITLGQDGATAAAPQAPAPAGKARAPAACASRAGGGALDYSKWDQLDVSDSEDEGEGDEDEGLERWAEGQAAAAQAAGKRWPGMDGPPPAEAAGGGGAAAAPAPAPAAKAAPPTGLTRNGGRTERYLWSQEKEEVSVAVLAPGGTSAKAVAVELGEERLRVGLRGAAGAEQPRWLVDGELLYKAEAPEDPTDVSPAPTPPAWDCADALSPQLDWEIRDLPAEESGGVADGEGGTPRVVVVTFKKKVPHGVVHWWKGVIKGDETIDVSAIAGRKLNADAATAWRDAHAQFVENAAKREPVEIC